MRLILSCTGVLVVGLQASRESEDESERERESLRASVSACLVCPASLRSPYSQRLNVSTCLRKALDIPFYRYTEMPSCTMGCSYVLTWLAEKRLEPCTCANVAVGEVP
jgi:hypothetical protein